MSTTETDGFAFSKNADLRALRIALQFGFGVAPRRKFRDFKAKDSRFCGLRRIVLSMSQMEMEGFALSGRVKLI